MEKFSVYPGGVQGLALIALRAALACVVLQPVLASSDQSLAVPIIWTIAAALAIGGLTRIAALCAAVSTIAHMAGPNLSTAAGCLNAVAVAILGPGAYALDARLYGRRVIHVDRQGPPPPSHPGQ